MPRNANCTNCPLHQTCRTVCIWGTGPKDAEVMFVGKDPGPDEDQQGVPFIGQTGKILNSWIKMSGLSREQVYVTNLLKCKTPNGRPATDVEMKACSAYLDEEIDEIKPKLIVALGADALKMLTGKAQITSLAGSIIESKKYGIPVYAAFHPSFILKRPDMMARAEIHFQNLREHTIGEQRVKAETKYIYADTFDKAEKLFTALKKQSLITFDFETTSLNFQAAKMLCISFSWKATTAVVLPILGFQEQEIWAPEQKEQILLWLKDIFAQEHITWVAHNISYDHKILLQNGIDIAGPIQDTMILTALVDENATDLRGLKPLAKVYTDMGDYDSPLQDYVVKLKADKLKQHQLLRQAIATRLKEERKNLTKLKKSGTDEEQLNAQVTVREVQYELEEFDEATDSKETSNISYADIPTEMLWPYAAMDADATYRIYTLFMQKLQEESDQKVKPYGKSMVQLYHKIVMPLRRVLNEVEFRGALLDTEYLKELDKQYTALTFKLEEELLGMDALKTVCDILYKKEVDALEIRYAKLKKKPLTFPEYAAKHAEHPEFNMNSPAQLSMLLYDVLKLAPFKWGKPSKKDGSVSPSADKEVLQAFADQHPAIGKLQENRQVQKLHSTYVKGMQKRVDYAQRIHTDFNQHITVTGRLSSSGPNLQNIPRTNKDIKKSFVPSPGCSLIQLDYSQAEFRYWGVYSGDPNMLRDIKAGVDIHRVTAAEFWKIPENDVTKEQRNAAKTIVFGLMYGRGAAAVAKQVGISEIDAKMIVNQFFSKYPVAARWLKEIQMFAKKNGYVMNSFGRVRRLPAVFAGNNEEESEAMRQATNSPIQGAVADMTGIGLIKIRNRLKAAGFKATIILTVHDSIILDCPDEELLDVITLCYNAMTEPLPGVAVPMGAEVEVGKNWGELTTAIAKEKSLDTLPEILKTYLENAA